MTIRDERKDSKSGKKKSSGRAAGSQPAGRVSASVVTGNPINLSRLAEHLRLSPTTVSLVLNDSPAGRSIPQRTRDRVIEAASRLGYRPNYFARSLRKSSSMSVGVLSPDLSEGYFTLVMSGVEEELLRSHYFYLTASHHWDEELIRTYPRMLEERAVDGLLVLNTPAVVASERPVVTISSNRHGENQTNIGLDHDLAAELALRHLYELGHRQIACMRGPSWSTDAEDRWRGIGKALRGMGLELDPHLSIHLEVTNSSPEEGYKAVAELLQRTRNFTAIFCFNDISAIGAMAAVRDAELHVPKDVSIIGFDDIISASFQTPKLTTVRQPLHDMGIEGARLLLERIKTPKERYPSEILMKPELMVRESTAQAPAKQHGRGKH